MQGQQYFVSIFFVPFPYVFPPGIPSLIAQRGVNHRNTQMAPQQDIRCCLYEAASARGVSEASDGSNTQAEDKKPSRESDGDSLQTRRIVTQRTRGSPRGVTL